MRERENLISATSQKKWPGLEVIKLFLCSTQLIMGFNLRINAKMPTIVGILTFMRRIIIETESKMSILFTSK